ncbi:TIGR00255 family protein [Monaibacterium marinum]|uniref:TIGR00255 family protein n=1 Tax=Pontivivens marinum TaxID=1690039 RepID=A0A2C9CM02_9RHOB|nr:YicC/YloC family endoribonuclease [Monaibacterium marinum]SOH92334.1 TIGR00255 family protein [Monaibacterium marinum]
MQSMTGFARIDGAADGMSWAWEARSVNSRGLDLRLRLPDAADALEAELRKAVPARIARGSVTISLRYTRLPGSSASIVNADALAAALAAIAEVESAAQSAGAPLTSPNATQILTLRGVMDGADVGYAWLETARAGIPALVEALSASRGEEGAKLRDILTASLTQVETLALRASDSAAARAARAGETLRTRLNALMAAPVDEGRLEQELALMAVKADVTEELDRLNAHIATGRELLAASGPIGRKFDFLMQEFNREANTLASKSNDVALTCIALDLKVIIDQMREQVQNVE